MGIILTFRPRINNVDMQPEFYSNTYTPDPRWITDPSNAIGPDKANPYSMASTASDMDQVCAYMWGRYNEATIYGNNYRAWRVPQYLGYIERTNVVGAPNPTYGYYDYRYWFDASMFNTSAYNYRNYDSITRVISGGVTLGDICFFHTGNRWSVGVVERIHNAHDYDVSTWSPSLRSVRIINIVNDSTASGLPYIGGIIADSTQIGNVDGVIAGKPIGYHIPIWMYKKYLDRQKGLI